jgi:hypothetical protein
VLFLVQFRRLRRGVPEVVRTFSVAAADRAAALSWAKGLAGTRHWPARTHTLRVMDEGGRTLLDWTAPVSVRPADTSNPGPVPTA